MKGKYITRQMLLLPRKKQESTKKDIYAELEETIAERKRILHELEKISQTGRLVEMIIGAPKAA